MKAYYYGRMLGVIIAGREYVLWKRENLLNIVRDNLRYRRTFNNKHWYITCTFPTTMNEHLTLEGFSKESYGEF